MHHFVYRYSIFPVYSLSNTITQCLMCDKKKTWENVSTEVLVTLVIGIQGDYMKLINFLLSFDNHNRFQHNNIYMKRLLLLLLVTKTIT